MARRHSRAPGQHSEGAELFEGISDVSLSLLKIFILLVFFLLIKASVEIFQNILPNQFTGRGGQPHLRILITTDPAVPGRDGIRFRIDNDQGKLELTWPELQSVFAHINKREFQSADPANSERLAVLTYKLERADDRGRDELRSDIAARLGLTLAEDADLRPVLIGALNRSDPVRAAEILAYKRKFTFDALDPGKGIDHQESIDSTEPKSFQWVPIGLRLGRRPLLWFTLAPDGTIPFGPPGPGQLRLQPPQFQMLLDGFRGNDGFYVEYRAKPELKGPGAEPPAAVAAILREAGYLDRVVRQDKLNIAAAPAAGSATAAATQPRP